jgi:ribosome-binding protein aMBF1 (putative translation factor)
MTTLMKEGGAVREQDRVIHAFVLGFSKLPPQRKERVEKLFELLEQSDCYEEQIEIAKAIGEIVVPTKVGRNDPPGSVADLEEGVGGTAKEQVAAYRKNVGNAIRKRRKQLKMTQEELAKKSGLPQSHISRLEDGKHSATEATIERLAKALDTEPSQLDLLYD